MKIRYDMGKILASVREEYNETHSEIITQTAMATKTKVNKSTISRIEKGQLTPSLEIVIAYHETFNVSMEYLIGESTSKQPENMKVGKDLGINDTAANTMKMIKSMSTPAYDYSAVLNAFIGNNENTFNLMTTLLSYFSTQYINKEQQNSNSHTMDALILSNLMTYIDHFVKPQLESVIEKNVAEQERLSNVQ